MSATLRAEFGMYPFAAVRWAWDGLWEAVRAHLDWAPAKLDHSGDAHRAWIDPNVAINHVCGWPFAAYHQRSMHLVGAFDLALPTEPGVGPALYRSVLLTPHRQRGLHDLIGSTAVINSADSLSGALSLFAATVGANRAWPGTVIETGAHIDSIAALLDGRADIGCIDSWTLALAADERPSLRSDLVRVGYGPIIPTPAVTVRDPDRVEELASAFATALADPDTAAVREALYIRGWERPDIELYNSTLNLETPQARRSLGAGPQANRPV